MSDRPPLPYGRQWVGDGDLEAIAAVLGGDWLTTGPAVEEFETKIAKQSGAAHAVAVSSGTAALHTAYAAAGVGPGTEVIVPSLTFSATANAAVHLGANVRFADVDDSLTMDPESAARLLTANTRVIAPVDFAGHAARLDNLLQLAQANGALLVEDAAHSLGGAFCGRPIGSVADLTIFSFHPVKVVTTGEGGAIVTNHYDLAEHMSRFRNHGMRHGGLDADPKAGGWAYDIDEPAFNYRLTDIQCAIGLSQLERLGGFIARRNVIAKQYREELATVHGLVLPPHKPWCNHAYHLFAIRVPAKKRRQIFDRLRERGILVQVHYIPVNMLAAYRNQGHRPEDTPQALAAYRGLISLPCYPRMTDEDVSRVVEAVNAVMRSLG